MTRFILAATLTTFLAGTALAEDAAKVWKDKCATCHGDTGKGDTKMGKKLEVADMTTAEWQKAVSDDAMKKAVTEGVDREVAGKKKKMKPVKEVTPEQLTALVTLMRSFAPKP